MLRLELPYPISVNHMWGYFRGRPVLTGRARAYRRRVAAILLAARVRPILGPLAVCIELHPPDHRKRDCDNAQKALLDALQHGGAFLDDAQVVWLLTIKCRPTAESGKAVVSIVRFGEEPLPLPGANVHLQVG